MEEKPFIMGSKRTIAFPTYDKKELDE